MRLMLAMTAWLVLGWTSDVDALVTNISCLITSTAIRAGTVTNTLSSPAPVLAFQNTDTSNPVWVCEAVTCTTATGFKLAPASTNGINSVTYGLHEYAGPL